MSHRTKKREFVWQQMRLPEEAGLGRREEFSQNRDKFILDPENPKAMRLSFKPDAKGGFVRSDNGSLLFRKARPELGARLPEELLNRSMKRKKERGLEFGWGQINESDIKLLFAAVMGLAASQLPDARDLDASDVISSHGQGFGLTSLQRKAVEARAMKLAIEHYRKTWEHVKDVSASRCYDLECRCGRKTPRVEV
jgi:hypothetical protein